MRAPPPERLRPEFVPHRLPIGGYALRAEAHNRRDPADSRSEMTQSRSHEAMSYLTLEQSNQIIRETLRKARELGLPPIGVAVLDPGGHLIALQREDELSFLRVRICQAKAWGALALGTDSRNLAQRYQQDILQQGFLDALNTMSQGGVIPLPGGVLVRDERGRVLGAVGVAGGPSEQDEACAIAGIEAVGLTANPAD